MRSADHSLRGGSDSSAGTSMRDARDRKHKLLSPPTPTSGGLPDRPETAEEFKEKHSILREMVSNTRFAMGELWVFDQSDEIEVADGTMDLSGRGLTLGRNSSLGVGGSAVDHSWHPTSVDHSWHSRAAGGHASAGGGGFSMPRTHSHQLLQSLNDRGGFDSPKTLDSPKVYRRRSSEQTAPRTVANGSKNGPMAPASEAGGGDWDEAGGISGSGIVLNDYADAQTGRLVPPSPLLGPMFAGVDEPPRSSERSYMPKVLAGLAAGLVRTGSGMVAAVTRSTTGMSTDGSGRRRSLVQNKTDMSSTSKNTKPYMVDDLDRPEKRIKFTGCRYTKPSFAGCDSGKPCVGGALPLEDKVLEDLLQLYSGPEAEVGKGQGLAGLTWQHGTRRYFVLRSLVEDPEAFQVQSVSVADRVFCAVLGIPVFHLASATSSSKPHGKMLGVVLLYLPYCPEAPRDGEQKEITKHVHRYLNAKENPQLSGYFEQVAQMLSVLSFKNALQRKVDNASGTLCFDTRGRAQARWRRIRVLVTTGWMRDWVPPPEEELPPVTVASTLDYFAVEVRKYFRKWKGKGAAAFNPPPRAGMAACFCTFVGTFLAILVIGLLQKANTHSDDGMVEPLLLLGCFGALATLLYAAPASPFAQPRMVIGGHLIGCVSALIVDYFTNPAFATAFIPQVVAVPLSVAITISLMAASGFIHPPGAACGMIFISASEEFREMGWAYLIPIMLGCLVCLLMALIVNNALPSRAYPIIW